MPVVLPQISHRAASELCQMSRSTLLSLTLRQWASPQAPGRAAVQAGLPALTPPLDILEPCQTSHSILLLLVLWPKAPEWSAVQRRPAKTSMSRRQAKRTSSRSKAPSSSKEKRRVNLSRARGINGEVLQGCITDRRYHVWNFRVKHMGVHFGRGNSSRRNSIRYYMQS